MELANCEEIFAECHKKCLLPLIGVELSFRQYLAYSLAQAKFFPTQIERFMLPLVTVMDQYGGHPAARVSLCWAHHLVGTLVLLRQSIMVPGLMVPGRGWDRPERTVPANVRPPPPPLPSDLRDCAGAWVLCAADPI